MGNPDGQSVSINARQRDGAQPGFGPVQRVLQGAALVTAALSVIACSTTDARTSQERTADRAIAQRVMVALQSDPYLDADHVDVDARGGTVRLSGKVGADHDLRQALRIAQAVPGVRRVDDELEIEDFGPRR
jgi:osmotically-inducible protein OsmY